MQGPRLRAMALEAVNPQGGVKALLPLGVLVARWVVGEDGRGSGVAELFEDGGLALGRGGPEGGFVGAGSDF